MKGAVVMKIDRINSIYQTYKSQSLVNTKKVEETSEVDELSLSETAKDFRSIYKMLGNVPDIRQEKVDTIKKQMEEGRYDVNAAQVARKILSQYDIRG